MGILYEYWQSHPQFWISIDNKKEADEEITRLWFNYSPTDFLDTVIYKDQCMRHFSRMSITNIDENKVQLARQDISRLVLEQKESLVSLNETQLVFSLMPLKHTQQFEEIFYIVSNWISNKNTSIKEYPLLSRLYEDTYRKAYTLKDSIKPVQAIKYEKYDGYKICENYPQKDLWALGDIPEYLTRKLCDFNEKDIVISLSGGVDSMVMATVAKRAGLDVRCIHIVYGNRDVSDEECSFLIDYCNTLSIPLWVYKIPWIRRNDVRRDFYESTTREIRFQAYKAICAKTVFLGHIREDIIENIWTNFAHGSHLDHLIKMDIRSEEEGVQIIRPWLFVKKDEIYNCAYSMNIPWLKNTTPSWSNRGKFRELFYNATHSQYGEQVDDKIIEVASLYRKQSLLVEELLFEPIFNSWSDIHRSIDVRCMLHKKNIDYQDWLRIFTWIAHDKLKCCKPSIKAVKDFTQKINKWKYDIDIHYSLKKEFSILLKKILSYM